MTGLPASFEAGSVRGAIARAKTISAEPIPPRNGEGDQPQAGGGAGAGLDLSNFISVTEHSLPPRMRPF